MIARGTSAGEEWRCFVCASRTRRRVAVGVEGTFSRTQPKRTTKMLHGGNHVGIRISGSCIFHAHTGGYLVPDVLAALTAIRQSHTRLLLGRQASWSPHQILLSRNRSAKIKKEKRKEKNVRIHGSAPARRYPALRGGALEARRVPQCVVVFMVGGVTYAEARAHAPSPSGRRFDLLNQSNHKIQSHRLSQKNHKTKEV